MPLMNHFSDAYAVPLQKRRSPQNVTPEKAVACIQSGQHIYIQGMAATPQALVQALAARSGELRAVEIFHMHTEGPTPYADPAAASSFHVHALFVGANMRDAVSRGQADYVPAFLSQVPCLIRDRTIPIDVALIQVSPPDMHGFCSLGVSIEAVREAIAAAGTVIAQVNRHMPRTHGDGLVHVSGIDYFCEVDTPLPQAGLVTPGEVDHEIGRRCAELIPDGATLQTGIGGIPNAVLRALSNHRDLGVHSEMFSDGMLELIERGVVTNAQKTIHPGKLVASFVMGTQRLYDFVDDNPQVALLDVAYTNNPAVIARNPKVAAINSAIEVDLTGQVCADSIGPHIFSGVGGQMDFMRGSAASQGGVSIIALPSMTGKGISRIVSTLKVGAGVVTTRADVHFVVTEHGVANLRGKSLSERARMMIPLAHPSHREALAREAFERFGLRS